MKIYGLLTAAVGLLLFAGCGERSADDPRLILAEKCREEGDFQAAERQFRRYLNAHPEVAAIHLKLASLYDESLKDPVGAAYHYREYLRLDPDSDQRKNVQAWLDEARRKCAGAAGKLLDDARKNAAELERMIKENASLRQLTLRQQRELAELRRPAAPVPAPAPVQDVVREQKKPAVQEKTQPASGEFYEYEIKRGDTLGRIARHYYGSSVKIAPIMEANALTPRSVLHIGQKLKIPKQAGVK